MVFQDGKKFFVICPFLGSLANEVVSPREIYPDRLDAKRLSRRLLRITKIREDLVSDLGRIFRTRPRLLKFPKKLEAQVNKFIELTGGEPPPFGIFKVKECKARSLFFKRRLQGHLRRGDLAEIQSDLAGRAFAYKRDVQFNRRGRADLDINRNCLGTSEAEYPVRDREILETVLELLSVSFLQLSSAEAFSQYLVRAHYSRPDTLLDEYLGYAPLEYSAELEPITTGAKRLLRLISGNDEVPTVEGQPFGSWSLYVDKFEAIEYRIRAIKRRRTQMLAGNGFSIEENCGGVRPLHAGLKIYKRSARPTPNSSNFTPACDRAAAPEI